ncbi:MAG TPA: thioredoxin family protein [Bacilli bacterium]|nr:thioredoxin family protein [Bacilli bacterium]
MSKISKIIFLIIILLGIVMILTINSNKITKRYKNIEKIVENINNSTDLKMVYIASNNCDECKLQSYQLKMLIKEYNIEYYYIDLNKISEARSKNIYEKLDLEVVTKSPTIAIYKDSKLVDSLIGLTGTNKLYKLLENNNIIVNKKLPINYLNLSSYVDILNNEKVIIGMGNYTSSYSNSFEEILFEINDEYDIDINFIYLNDLSESEGNLFESKINNFDEMNLKVPSLIIVENNEITDKIIGLSSKEEYVEFLKNNGII